MKQLYKATLYRMYKTKGVRTAVALTYLAAIGYYILASMVAHGDMGVDMAGNITGLADAMIIWLFGSLTVGILVGDDFENKIIHSSISYGRKKIVINYMLVYITMMIVLLLPYLIGSIVLITARIDMSGAQPTAVTVFMDNAIKYNSETNILKLILSYLSHIVVTISQISICIIVAMKVKKTVAVTAFGFIFGMFTALISALVSEVKILDNIYKLTPYNYSISRLGLTADVIDMYAGIGVSIIFICICGIIGWLIFKKSDIK
jgi:ABC-2 type transport system permease protein